MADLRPDEENAIAQGSVAIDGPHDVADTPSDTEKTYQKRSSALTRFRHHMLVDVDPKWADLILIMCFYVSGVVDSVAFNVWSCFASMQTGNTIFVGLGVSGQPFNAAPFGWAKSLTAILCFIIGAFTFSNFHRALGPTRRYVMIISFAVQASLIMIAAILATVGGVVSSSVTNDRIYTPETDRYHFSVKPINWNDLAPLALLAFQSSGQVVASRMLKYNELPTVVLTSLFCDLMSDADLLTVPITGNAKRNRRAVAAVFLFIGALSGGFLTKSWVGLAGALWLAAGIKGLMVLCWIFWFTAAKKR